MWARAEGGTDPRRPRSSWVILPFLQLSCQTGDSRRVQFSLGASLYASIRCMVPPPPPAPTPGVGARLWGFGAGALRPPQREGAGGMGFIPVQNAARWLAPKRTTPILVSPAWGEDRQPRRPRGAEDGGRGVQPGGRRGASPRSCERRGSTAIAPTGPRRRNGRRPGALGAVPRTGPRGSRLSGQRSWGRRTARGRRAGARPARLRG